MEAAAEEHMGEFGSNQQEAISNAEGFSFFSKLHYLMALSGPARFGAAMQGQTKLVALALLLIRPHCSIHVVHKLPAASCF